MDFQIGCCYWMLSKGEGRVWCVENAEVRTHLDWDRRQQETRSSLRLFNQRRRKWWINPFLWRRNAELETACILLRQVA